MLSTELFKELKITSIIGRLYFHSQHDVKFLKPRKILSHWKFSNFNEAQNLKFEWICAWIVYIEMKRNRNQLNFNFLICDRNLFKKNINQRLNAIELTSMHYCINNILCNDTDGRSNDYKNFLEISAKILMASINILFHMWNM